MEMDAQTTSTYTFRCDECKKDFSGQSELTRHLNENRVHKPAIPCLFPGCPKAYRRPGSIKTHFWDGHGKALGRFASPSPLK